MVRRIGLTFVLMAAPAIGRPAPDVPVPADIGAAYGRLGRAMQSHDPAGVKTVWAEDFIVNAPNNEILHRDEVIAAMRQDLLDYSGFRKHITFIGEKPEITVVMGYDTMVPLKGPGAGKQVVRPFTDIWARRNGGWMLIARQATIAAAR